MMVPNVAVTNTFNIFKANMYNETKLDKFPKYLSRQVFNLFPDIFHIFKYFMK